MWDLGSILYRLATGVRPFNCANQQVYVRLVEKYHVAFAKNMDLSAIESAYKELVVMLMAKQQEERLGYYWAEKDGETMQEGIADIRMHRYLS